VTASAVSSYLVGLAACLAAIAVMPRNNRRWQLVCLLLIVALVLSFLLLLPVSPQRRWWLGFGAAAAILVVLASRVVWDRFQNRPPSGIVDFRVDTPAQAEVMQRFSSSQVALVAHGKYYGEAVAVRPLLIDKDGRFYLQDPEVELRDDTSWVSTNIRPEVGIDSVAFVAVGKRGRAHFNRMAAENKWGGFSVLPRNTRLLESVHIVVT
jgi:hypothetical protein